jgi:murein DD-endopeptidase MepM/ murein hydrolase activator NlpD
VAVKGSPQLRRACAILDGRALRASPHRRIDWSAEMALLLPTPGTNITQAFDGSHPFEAAGFLQSDAGGARRARRSQFAGGSPCAHLHGAIDFGCRIGTPVLAPEAGKIVLSGVYPSTGENYMMLQIRPGTILFFTHLSGFIAAVGRTVNRGAAIAWSGNSGKSTGPHLHYEVRIAANPAANFRLSGRWFKWNPMRLSGHGDLAGLPAIQPLGAEPPAGVGPVSDEPAEDETEPTMEDIGPDAGAGGAADTEAGPAAT